MTCGSSFLYIKKTLQKKHLFAFVPSRCKSWSCPKCRQIKAGIVRNYIIDNFTGDDLYLLTLTFYHSGSVLQCWKSLGVCWNRMRTYISKYYGSFNYLRIVEPHKSGGWPHLHILVKGCVIDSKILKLVPKWGFGWNAHVLRLSSASAANYISKYLSKKWPDTQSEVLRVASKCRIVSVSRGMPPIFTVASEWSVVRHSVPGEHAQFMCNAIIGLLKDNNSKSILSRPFADGFIIESDIDLRDSWLETFFDPYVWEYCNDYHFSYLPFGLQMELTL